MPMIYSVASHVAAALAAVLFVLGWRLVARRARRRHRIDAFWRTQGIESLQSLGISSRSGGFGALFSTHPPMEERIARLQQAAA